MDSKFKSTKRMEKEGKTPAAKRMTKETLIKNSRDKLYSNLRDVFIQNKDAKEVGPAAPKKQANDIIKRNKAAAAVKAPKAPPKTAQAAERPKPKMAPEQVNI